MRSPPAYFLFLLALASSLHAQPTLDHTFPTAISHQGGQIILHGSGLKEPLAIWSSAPVDATFSKISSTSTTCQLTFPNAVDQLLALRLSTSYGISNPVLIAIDNLSTVASSNNKSLKDPQPITIPAAIEGAIDEFSSHFYKF